MKRIFSAVITACLLLVTLSACGGNNDKSNSDKQTAAKTENASAADHFSGETKSTKSSVKDNSGTSNQQIVTVPNVTRININEAKQKLAELKLTPVTEYVHYVDKAGKRLNDFKNLEDDGLVLSQDIPKGTVCAPYTVVKLKVNSNSNPFEYTENDDGTIILTKCRYGHSENGRIVVPSIYEEKTVVAITEDAINNLDLRLTDSGNKISIPKNVKVLGNPDMKRVIFE